jgi:hypothetical protein
MYPASPGLLSPATEHLVTPPAHLPTGDTLVSTLTVDQLRAVVIAAIREERVAPVAPPPLKFVRRTYRNGSTTPTTDDERQRAWEARIADVREAVERALDQLSAAGPSAAAGSCT